MTKLIPLLALALTASVVLTSCTAVVETPAPTTTTVRTERAAVSTPAATPTTTTTTRAGGY